MSALHKTERFILRDTKHGEWVFGSTVRWKLTSENLHITEEIAAALNRALLGKMFDLRIVERFGETEHETASTPSLILSAPIRADIDRDCSLVIPTTGEVFDFPAETTYGPTIVHHLGSAAHVFVPHFGGMTRYVFHRFRRP